MSMEVCEIIGFSREMIFADSEDISRLPELIRKMSKN